TDGLSAGAAGAIHEDTAGTIWVGTFQGLSRFARGRFVSIASHSRSLGGGGRLTAIVEDGQGYLWLGTDAGLVRIRRDEFDKAAGDPAYSMQYRLLDVSDGFEGRPTSQGQPTSTRSSDGTLWFVTSRGLAALDPRALREYPRPVAPVIERILADERAFFPESQLSLSPRTARVQIDYTSLSFAAPSRILFRYRLDGYDQSWVNAGNRRQAFYTNLPPRSYQFRVAASRGDGVWMESPAILGFAIARAFYQTTWFYAASAGIVVLALSGVWRLRLRQVRKQFSVVLAERERLAREIHDTLLQGMLGVALQLHGISETLNSPLSTTKGRCERARDNLEYYIRETRLSIWDLRSPTHETRDLATALHETIDRAATSAVRVSLKVAGKPRPCGQVIERHMLRIGQEAISNAVRHAEATHVRVELGYDGTSVLLRVSDNGRGFDPEDAAHASVAHWGLRSMRERAEQIGGHLRLTSTPGRGTEIEAIIPLSE
ncbi:MAG TPA: ATP-binding protein, partial [Rhodothermia bacterium]